MFDVRGREGAIHLWALRPSAPLSSPVERSADPADVAEPPAPAGGRTR
jgi:hypothetical protein